MKRTWILIIPALSLAPACATATATGATALEVIAPVAAKAITDAVMARFDATVDEETASCVPLDESFDDGGDEEWTYAICRGKPERR